MEKLFTHMYLCHGRYNFWSQRRRCFVAGKVAVGVEESNDSLLLGCRRRHLLADSVPTPALNLRPALKSPWISETWKGPWTVLEKEWKALKSLEVVYRESFNKTWWLGDCTNLLP